MKRVKRDTDARDSTLTDDPELRATHRKQSGQTARPFSDAGVTRYGTTRRQPSFTWGDEYPPASAQEGGGTGTTKAIIQGAPPPDQQSKLHPVLHFSLESYLIYLSQGKVPGSMPSGKISTTEVRSNYRSPIGTSTKGQRAHVRRINYPTAHEY